jgi:hypothetical protein
MGPTPLRNTGIAIIRLRLFGSIPSSPPPVAFPAQTTFLPQVGALLQSALRQIVGSSRSREEICPCRRWREGKETSMDIVDRINSCQSFAEGYCPHQALMEPLYLTHHVLRN